MKSSSPPDPRQAAQREAKQINENRFAHVQGTLDRLLDNFRNVNRQTIVDDVVAFHRERMAKVPSPAKYPESPAWVHYVLEVDRLVMELTGLSERDMAIIRSLHAFATFRGRFAGAVAAPVSAEKCRVAYLPDTDRGAMHIKNVDDPPTFWKKRPPMTEYPFKGLVWDGTGSGLHFDEEPDEIFPLPINAMCLSMFDDVPGAVEFLTRYCPFWGRCNVVLYDQKKRSVAIEKCSHKHIEVFEPGPTGRSHISGMVCRNPDSPQARHQKAMRDQYRKHCNIPDDSPDVDFWNRAMGMEKKLAAAVDTPKTVKADDLLTLFTTPVSQGGLCKDGTKSHPKQTVREFTLVTHAAFPDERTVVRWQRDDKEPYAWPSEPEVYDFSRS